MSAFWSLLTAAPHRLLFMVGTLNALASLAWWLVELAARLGGLPVEPVAGASERHAWTMLFGLMPAFMFGFLFTAMPNWLSAPGVARNRHVMVALLLLAGSALHHASLFLAELAVPALAIHCIGLALGVEALLRVLRQARVDDRRHALACTLALAALAASEALWLAGRVGAWPGGIALAIHGALWWGLLPVFLSVAHRMIPWFSSRVIQPYTLVRPYPALWIMLAACAGHGLLAGMGRPEWTGPADLLLAGLAFWFSARWQPLRAWPIPLLAMLHVGFIWAGVAFALFAIDSLVRLGGAAFDLGFAPLHALGIGFMLALLAAMAARVSLGHSGRQLEADGLTQTAFWLIQASAFIRLLADLMPARTYLPLLVIAATLLFAGLAAWAWRYAPWYWQPRIDGKPG